jgi:virginiamycin A acetyltransferase
MNYIKSKIRKIIRLIWLKWYWFLMNRKHHHDVASWNVGRQARIGYKAIIREGVEIGNDVFLGDYSYISGPRTYVESAKIGKFCSIARQTVIGVGNHDHSLVTTHPFIISPEFGGLVDRSIMAQQKPAPVIGNDVWIGINSIIMRGVTIGDGAVIAANSVVTRDVPPYAIFGGVPAKLIRYRFSDEIIRALLQIRWWDWPSSKIKQNVRDFSSPERFVDIHAVSVTHGE